MSPSVGTCKGHCACPCRKAIKRSSTFIPILTRSPRRVTAIACQLFHRIAAQYVEHQRSARKKPMTRASSLTWHWFASLAVPPVTWLRNGGQPGGPRPNQSRSPSHPGVVPGYRRMLPIPHDPGKS